MVYIFSNIPCTSISHRIIWFHLTIPKFYVFRKGFQTNLEQISFWANVLCKPLSLVSHILSKNLQINDFSVCLYNPPTNNIIIIPRLIFNFIINFVWKIWNPQLVPRPARTQATRAFPTTLPKAAGIIFRDECESHWTVGFWKSACLLPNRCDIDCRISYIELLVEGLVYKVISNLIATKRIRK